MKVGYEEEIYKIHTDWSAKQQNILLEYTLEFKYYIFGCWRIKSSQVTYNCLKQGRINS